MRSDIADVRLAGMVFAPRYAEPLSTRLTGTVALHQGRESGSAVLATLDSGDAFDLLDVSGGVAWGIATGRNLVGYIDAGAIA